MSDYQATFERKEKKYLLTIPEQRDIMQLLDEHMQVDEYGLHTISSIYMDTDTYNVIRACSSKPAYKEKVRLRAYGTPGPMDTVYMELKKKVDGIVYKRRIGLPLREAERYLRAGVRPSERGQIFDEIDWALARTKAKPKICVSYDRLALYGIEDPDFRVTFDFRMRFRESELSLSKGSFGTYLISPELCLMEVKAAGALPMWLAQYLSTHRIFSTSFSKYGTAYEEYICKNCQKGELRHVG